MKVKLLDQSGRKLEFAIVANDGIDTLTEGMHERVRIDAPRFAEKLH